MLYVLAVGVTSAPQMQDPSPRCLHCRSLLPVQGQDLKKNLVKFFFLRGNPMQWMYERIVSSTQATCAVLQRVHMSSLIEAWAHLGMGLCTGIWSLNVKMISWWSIVAALAIYTGSSLNHSRAHVGS